VSYHIYTTKGIMLASRPWREADRIYSILTRELGLIRATAIGVRKEASKLRGALEPFSLATVSLVRGREYWRATSAQFIRNIPPSPAIARPFYLLEKMIQGEAPHPELFDEIELAVLSPTFDDETSEIHLVSKILFHLGYLKESDLDLNKKELVKVINKGLEASHL